MNQQIKLFSFLNLFYKDSRIPIYVYEQGKLTAAFPEQTELTYPPEQYLQRLFKDSRLISYCSTPYGIYYGCVHMTSSEHSHLIFGPVSNIPYTSQDIHHLFTDYIVPMNKQTLFREFLQYSPELSLTAFLQKLILVNYCINQSELSLEDLMATEKHADDISDDANITKKTFLQKEDLIYNKSYEIESLMASLVRTGNPEGIRNLPFNDSQIHAGVTGPTALRQLKNNLIISTTLATRAAIDGGLDPSTAYQLSDDFIQTIERVQNSDYLNELFARIFYIFAQKVSEVQTPNTTDKTLQNAIRFIQQNTNQSITVTDVARHVGFSRTYFSTFFKKEIGFSVAAFIMRCKLEEGRKLLLHTNKSISNISSYLCFSNQSHFQTAFKKQFGMTPMQYRKNPDISRTNQKT